MWLNGIVLAGYIQIKIILSAVDYTNCVVRICDVYIRCCYMLWGVGDDDDGRGIR